jgi:hypothetical protein
MTRVALVRYDTACRALAQAKSLGELIMAQKHSVGLAHGGDAQRTRFHKGTESPRPTLAEVGIDKKLSSRAQQGRSQSWAPSSVRAILFGDMYRGPLAWNKTKKRDALGQQRQHGRPQSEWIIVPAEQLRIVSDTEWQAAHDRLSAARAIYLRGTNRERFGRPALGSPSPYLLTNFGQCGVCGHPLRVCIRSHVTKRARFYGCSGYHDRGRAVCTNRADIPMADADDILIEALLDDVLDESMVTEAIDEAMRLLQPEAGPSREDAIRRELAQLETERRRLGRAIAIGGDLDDLVLAVRERDQRRQDLEEELRVSVTASDYLGQNTILCACQQLTAHMFTTATRSAIPDASWQNSTRPAAPYRSRKPPTRSASAT